MQAIKAIYSDGAITFLKSPSLKGTHEVIVVLPDEANIDHYEANRLVFEGTPQMDKILDSELEWQPKKFIKR